MQLRGKQKRFLRSEAHHLTPIFQIGKGGINDNMIADLSAALDAHELVKITVLRNASDEPRALIRALSSALGAEEVSVVGSKLVLYRRSTRDGVAHIEL